VNCNRFRIGILRVSGKDLGVEENPFAVIFLGAERRTGQQKKEWGSE
jgi:hypothetical protein